VGGLRSFSEMEEIVKNNYADFISLSRPFIREPFLIKYFKEGKQDKASCISCNRCLAALIHDFPVQCYVNKFPETK
jgi:2,4-dienoyl-CoA reductase-like NADH-dependent reductase (Old Yellow Enzyme family)